MRRGFVCAVAAICALPAVASAAKKRPSKQYTIEQFMNTRRVAGAFFAPDEKTILVTADDDKGVLNVYTVAAAGGALAPVTQSAETTFAVGYFPKDGRILYTRDQGGNEPFWVYASVELTKNPKADGASALEVEHKWGKRNVVPSTVARVLAKDSLIIAPPAALGADLHTIGWLDEGIEIFQHLFRRGPSTP